MGYNAAIINLNKYIKEDAFYSGKIKPEDKVEKEQLKHCQEIKEVLDLVKKQKDKLFKTEKEGTKAKKELANKIYKVIEKEI